MHNIYLSHRIIDSFPLISKWKITRLKPIFSKGPIARANKTGFSYYDFYLNIRGKLTIVRRYTLFSVWLRTDWNPADINRFQSHTRKVLQLPSVKSTGFADLFNSLTPNSCSLSCDNCFVDFSDAVCNKINLLVWKVYFNLGKSIFPQTLYLRLKYNMVH